MSLLSKYVAVQLAKFCHGERLSLFFTAVEIKD